MHPALRAIYAAVRPARVLLAPEMWSRNDAFKSMVPPLTELLCVPLYDAPAGERAEFAEFYSWIGSAAFIVFRVRSEAEWRLSKGASDEPTAEGDTLTHRVLARLFSEGGAKHLERTSIEDLQSEKSAVVAATCIGDARALSRANMIDPAAVESLSDLTKAHEGAMALSAIDEGAIKQPREICFEECTGLTQANSLIEFMAHGFRHRE